jgi:hypothetical protein
VAIDSGKLLVGTYYEDSSAIGVDNDPTDNSMTDAGAAYIYSISTGNDHTFFLPILIR